MTRTNKNGSPDRRCGAKLPFGGGEIGLLKMLKAMRTIVRPVRKNNRQRLAA